VAATVLTGLAVAALGWGTVPVARVELDPPRVASPEALSGAFGVAQGSPLSREEIRAGVQSLLATKQVEDVVVEVEETPAGAVIRVHVQPVSRIRSVEVTGLSRLQARRVRSDLALTPGAPLNVAAFEAGIERTRQMLQNRGYPAATVDPDLSFDPAHGTVDVSVAARLGAPRKLAELSAPGAEIDRGAIWKVCKLNPGQVLTSVALETARRRLSETLRKSGYWEAEIDSAEVGEIAGGASVRFAVQRGPHWELRLEGLKRTKSLEVEALPFVRGDEPFSDAALEIVVARLRMYLQQQGRLLASVEGEIAREEKGKVLNLRVKEGPKTPILAVRFPGAHTLTEREMREKIGARPGKYWRWGAEPVDDDTLAADAASLLGTLRDAGLADAKVGEARILPKAGGADVEFPVEEGTRRTVERLETGGVPATVKEPKFALKPGAPWSERAEEQARVALESALAEAGYADATVAASHECGPERCVVRLQAEPGSPSVIGRVVVAGLVKTRRSVVDAISGIKEGAIAGPEAQLAAQRRLLALGIFDSVDLHPIPGQESGARRALVLDLKEGPTRAIAFGVGYDTESKARVSVTWSELNLFGGARSISADLRLSSREERIQVTYREPARLSLLGVPTWVSVYRSQNYYTGYDVLQRGMWIEFGDHFRRPFRTILRYEYLIVNPTAPPDLLTSIEREQQRDRISSITPSIEWDTRDDVFSPHKGLYASLSWQFAFKFLLADAEFNKITASTSYFSPAFGGVLALSVRGGAIEPTNHAAGTPDNLMVPINERFFGGGRVSQRAFPTDLLGIPNQTLLCEPPSNGTTSGCQVVGTGGAGLLLGSAEWRFPILGPVGGSVFVDTGNVWQAWREIDVAGVRWGGGVGLRVETPVGPLRLEYGWKFDPRSWVAGDGSIVKESTGELFFSFGNAF